jgi:hypothetical protein
MAKVEVPAMDVRWPESEPPSTDLPLSPAARTATRQSFPSS